MSIELKDLEKIFCKIQELLESLVLKNESKKKAKCILGYKQGQLEGANRGESSNSDWKSFSIGLERNCDDNPDSIKQCYAVMREQLEEEFNNFAGGAHE